MQSQVQGADDSDREAMVSATTLGRGLAVLRIFVGIIFLANGIAKLTGDRNIVIGWYRGSLIPRPEARQILDFEVN